MLPVLWKFHASPKQHLVLWGEHSMHRLSSNKCRICFAIHVRALRESFNLLECVWRRSTMSWFSAVVGSHLMLVYPLHRLFKGAANLIATRPRPWLPVLTWLHDAAFALWTRSTNRYPACSLTKIEGYRGLMEHLGHARPLAAVSDAISSSHITRRLQARGREHWVAVHRILSVRGWCMVRSGHSQRAKYGERKLYSTDTLWDERGWTWIFVIRDPTQYRT